MARRDWDPDCIVGIDFGMTCTGVAYSIGPEWPPPRTIQQWPSKFGGAIANKVATAIAYDNRTGAPCTWGMLCDEVRSEAPHSSALRIEELFKLHLDPEYCDPHPFAPSFASAQEWFRDYMRYLYVCIQDYFNERIPYWNNRNVEFLFSQPTTWTNPALIAQIESLIRSAGFGENQNQIVRMSLTEAEAAAVYTAKQNYDRDDVFLVCDAGGGTTDVNILKITTPGSCTQLRPLSNVEGVAIGSTMIDHKMTRIIAQRLELIKRSLPGSPQDTAEQMISGRFETFKCSFGSDVLNVEKLPLSVPGLEPGQNYPQASIEDSKMIIKRDELRQLFNEQIEKIFRLIDSQLERLAMSHARETISYLVVSGGFGSSPYVRQRFKERYEVGAGRLYANAQNMKILLTPEPQLAVCHGLVQSRLQEVTINHNVYTHRCCRVSYGVVIREIYDRHKHQGESVSRDPLDKKIWAENQIHWVIKKGDQVSITDAITHHFRLKRSLGQECAPWRAQVVMSALPPGSLPPSTKHSGVVKVCSVEARLDPADLRRKNDKWWHWSREYSQAEFDMRIRIGPADLRFEVVGRSGVLSGAHERIAVEWERPRRGGEEVEG